MVYRVPGTEPGAPTLALVPHLDVVPANPTGWSVDPFSAEISDGFVWGRGAIDMLNVTAAMAQAYKPYLDGQATDLISIAVADEEKVGSYGAVPLVNDCWSLVGADYLLTEVAYPSIPGSNGPLFPVAVGEKGPPWTRLETSGTPGHGSASYGAENALAPLTEALHGLFETPALTDARFWRASGTIAYGVGLHDDAIGFGEFLSLFHGRDERVSLSSVDLTTELLKTVLAGFTADPGV